MELRRSRFAAKLARRPGILALMDHLGRGCGGYEVLGAVNAILSPRVPALGRASPGGFSPTGQLYEQLKRREVHPDELYGGSEADVRDGIQIIANEVSAAYAGNG